jgi:nicotinamide phosphoribosyltransferase
MKATYGEVNGTGKEIYKDPKTDDGTKKSARGLLQVYRDTMGRLALKDQCTWEEEATGELKTVYLDGQLLVDDSLATIRQRVQQHLTQEA